MPQFPEDLVTFAEEIFNGKFHFLCSESNSFFRPLDVSLRQILRQLLSEDVSSQTLRIVLVNHITNHKLHVGPDIRYYMKAYKIFSKIQIAEEQTKYHLINRQLVFIRFIWILTSLNEKNNKKAMLIGRVTTLTYVFCLIEVLKRPSIMFMLQLGVR